MTKTRQRCKNCGNRIRVMIRKNTGFCTEDCEAEYNDPRL